MQSLASPFAAPPSCTHAREQHIFLAQYRGSMMWSEKLLFSLCPRNLRNAIGMRDPTVKAAQILNSAERCYYAVLNLSTALKDCDKTNDTENYFSGSVFLKILCFSLLNQA